MSHTSTPAGRWSAAILVLSDEQLERVIHDTSGEFSADDRRIAAQLLLPRLTVTVAAKHFADLDMPELCGLCGSPSVSGTSIVTGSYGAGEEQKSVSLRVPLCGSCKGPAIA